MAKFAVNGDKALAAVRIIEDEVVAMGKDAKVLGEDFAEESKDSGLVFLKRISGKLSSCTEVITSIQPVIRDIVDTLTTYVNDTNKFSEGE